MTFLECWQRAAMALVPQALAGEPRLEEAGPAPPRDAFGWAYRIEGDQQGRFVVAVDPGVLELPLLGEGVDQKSAWCELLREIADAACGELLARAGQRVRVATAEDIVGELRPTRAFQMRCGDKEFPLFVEDATTPRTAERDDGAEGAAQRSQQAGSDPVGSDLAGSDLGAEDRGRDLLLDVELETTLRFGCRELPLGELLELGPGDVVQLDRHVNAPVDLVVGDKIVARGEVVLVNGNFGLRVTEVAEPRKRLETIRCLF